METTTEQRLSTGWRLVLAAFLVGAAVSAVNAAQALGLDGILATALSSTLTILIAAPALDLTRVGGPIGRITTSLADSSRVWGAVVGREGSRVPVTVLVAVAGIGAGILVQALSVVIPAWLAVVLVVASVHLSYRAALARIGVPTPPPGKAVQAIMAELRRGETAAWILDHTRQEGSPARKAALLAAALLRGVFAAIGGAIILWLLALPLGWLLATVGLLAAAVVVAPDLSRQWAARALRSTT